MYFYSTYFTLPALLASQVFHPPLLTVSGLAILEGTRVGFMMSCLTIPTPPSREDGGRFSGGICGSCTAALQSSSIPRPVSSCIACSTASYPPDIKPPPMKQGLKENQPYDQTRVTNYECATPTTISSYLSLTRGVR